MEIDFTKGRVSLALIPQDMRCGYNRLALIASEFMNIDMSKNEDWVVFISRNRNIAKIIKHDAYGSIMITRQLDEGKFQQLLARIEGPASEPLTPEELASYLDGKNLMVKRSNPYYG